MTTPTTTFATERQLLQIANAHTQAIAALSARCSALEDELAAARTLKLEKVILRDSKGRACGIASVPEGLTAQLESDSTASPSAAPAIADPIPPPALSSVNGRRPIGFQITETAQR